MARRHPSLWAQCIGLAPRNSTGRAPVGRGHLIARRSSCGSRAIDAGALETILSRWLHLIIPALCRLHDKGDRQSVLSCTIVSAERGRVGARWCAALTISHFDAAPRTAAAIARPWRNRLIRDRIAVNKGGRVAG